MKNKIKNFSMSKSQFILELTSIQVDYFITVGEMKELCNIIIAEGNRRDLCLKEKSVISFLRRQWCEAETAFLVQYEIIKTTFETIFEKEQNMIKVITTLRRNIRRLVKRRGKRETKQYLRKLIKDYPNYSQIFEEALRELK